MKNRRINILGACLLLTFAIMNLSAQELPVPDKPTDWVNDYANVFSSAERENLSRKLNAFQYANSTQIFIITLDKNNGYPASELGFLIGEKWEVGQKGKDNGLLVVMDMKDRDVFITTGYGLEEYITDALAKRIVENEIIPAFKEGDYYFGIDAATNVMISLLEGKFTPDEYRKQTASSDAGSAIGGIFFMIMIFFALFGSRRRSVGAGGKSNLPLWIALGMMSGSRSRGSFGNFSSGSGGFGGGFGGGGFTGGGGGSFGGGGAGGSW